MPGKEHQGKAVHLLSKSDITLRADVARGRDESVDYIGTGKAF
jgi:hypothetical protein